MVDRSDYEEDENSPRAQESNLRYSDKLYTDEDELRGYDPPVPRPLFFDVIASMEIHFVIIRFNLLYKDFWHRRTYVHPVFYAEIYVEDRDRSFFATSFKNLSKPNLSGLTFQSQLLLEGKRPSDCT